MITRSAFTVVFLLKTGRFLIQFGRNTQHGARNVFVIYLKVIEFALNIAQVLKNAQGF